VVAELDLIRAPARQASTLVIWVLAEVT